MKTVNLQVVEEKSKIRKHISLPIKESKELEKILSKSKRYLIHKFTTSLPNLKLSMSEDIYALNALVLNFSLFSNNEKNKVLALCEKGLEFRKAVTEADNYELLQEVLEISDYGMYVAENEANLSKRMLSRIDMRSYGESMLKLNKEVLFSSYGLLRKEK